MTTALYPGRFDPVTNGHLNIVSRAVSLFDRVVVAVFDLEQEYLFSTEERVGLFREAVKNMPGVAVESFQGLTVNFARSQSATVLVRGIRAVTGFEAEFDMALMNKEMAPEIESVYLMASREHLFISGARIRELAHFDYDVSKLVPAHVAKALRRKLGVNRK